MTIKTYRRLYYCFFISDRPEEFFYLGKTKAISYENANHPNVGHFIVYDN